MIATLIDLWVRVLDLVQTHSDHPTWTRELKNSPCKTDVRTLSKWSKKSQWSLRSLLSRPTGRWNTIVQRKTLALPKKSLKHRGKCPPTPSLERAMWIGEKASKQSSRKKPTRMSRGLKASENTLIFIFTDGTLSLFSPTRSKEVRIT